MPSEILVKKYIYIPDYKISLAFFVLSNLLCFTQSQARHWFSLSGQFLIIFNNLRLI